MVLHVCSGCAPDVLQMCALGHAHALPTPNGTPWTRTNMQGSAQTERSQPDTPTSRGVRRTNRHKKTIACRTSTRHTDHG
eukprot:4654074-Prymnesium_polylepis.1